MAAVDPTVKATIEGGTTFNMAEGHDEGEPTHLENAGSSLAFSGKASIEPVKDKFELGIRKLKFGGTYLPYHLRYESALTTAEASAVEAGTDPEAIDESSLVIPEGWTPSNEAAFYANVYYADFEFKINDKGWFFGPGVAYTSDDDHTEYRLGAGFNPTDASFDLTARSYIPSTQWYYAVSTELVMPTFLGENTVYGETNFSDVPKELELSAAVIAPAGPLGFVVPRFTVNGSALGDPYNSGSTITGELAVVKSATAYDAYDAHIEGSYNYNSWFHRATFSVTRNSVHSTSESSAITLGDRQSFNDVLTTSTQFDAALYFGSPKIGFPVKIQESDRKIEWLPVDFYLKGTLGGSSTTQSWTVMDDIDHGTKDVADPGTTTGIAFAVMSGIKMSLGIK